MTDPEGHPCPECGAPRGGDNTPSCGCARRASDALREARTAQAAAAEDFDPLRIRPYVDLEGATEGTMPLRTVGPDLRPFETARPPGPPPEPAVPAPAVPARRPGRRGPRTRTVLLAAGGAVVAVVAAAGLAAGLFSYEPPPRHTALPDDVRASVPAPPTSSTPRPPAESSAPASRPVPPPAPTGPAPSPSVSSASTSASPSPSVAPSRSPAGPTPTASATDTISAGGNQRTRPPVLRRGDSGPEVKELELRLTQLGLYTRKASGHYDEGVEDAVTRYQQARGIQPQQYGVYDLETRSRLESETSQP
ncbi:peptidoglycan-binding domain-containing protein [Streptomyces sp. NPDC001139]